MRIKIGFFLYFVGILSLFLFSFTQVDLSLTLSRISIWQVLEKNFQHIGYFQRLLSSEWYVVTLILLFTSYLIFLIEAKKGKLRRGTLWKMIIVSSVFLGFSYNGFSYDIFNYIFSGKIITFYHQNPYLHKALDFTGDPMLSFMHWTHNTYPYGPSWLGVSVVLSFLGFNIFLLNFFLFKFLAVFSFLSSSYLIEKISQKINLDKPIFNLTFFALNPLVIIESLVSGHNDIFMMAFSLLGIFLLLNGRKAYSIISLVMSFLVKWVSGVLFLPYLLYIFLPKQFKKAENFIAISLIVLVLGLIYALTKYEMQPWYFLWVLPFVALYKKTPLILSLVFGLCVGLLLTYLPFFLNGNWGPPIPTIKVITIVASGIVTPIIFYIWLILRKKIV